MSTDPQGWEYDIAKITVSDLSMEMALAAMNQIDERGYEVCEVVKTITKEGMPISQIIFLVRRPESAKLDIKPRQKWEYQIFQIRVNEISPEGLLSAIKAVRDDGFEYMFQMLTQPSPDDAGGMFILAGRKPKSLIELAGSGMSLSSLKS